MPKSERLFEMLRYIREYPNLTAEDLARLCNVSERGIYRYLNTLSRAGIPIRLQRGKYRVPDDEVDLLKKIDIEALRAIRELLSVGMDNCDDDDLLRYGRNFASLIDENLPKKRRTPDEIEVIPQRVEASRYGGTITIGHSSKPGIINPILASNTISVNLMSLIFSRLVEFDNSGKPVPDLAKSWEISEDGLVWTFFLRDDVKFHDGHPLTAHDVEFTYSSIMDPRNMSPVAERCGLLDRIETEGDYIFRAILKHPFSPLIHRLNREIAPKHLLENVDLRNTPFNRHPVGSGPFRLVDWSEDDTITLDAHREYFRKGRPILDRLIFKAYPDRKSALQAIARGKMDIALHLAASDLLFASRRRPFRVYSAPGLSYYAVILNLKDPLFGDIRVRKALDYAIDRDSIARNQLKGHGKISTGPFHVNSWAYNPDVQPTPYSVEKAKELLGQAGWKDTDGDGILDRDGKPLELSITVLNISDNLERLAVAIRAQLMRAGIGVNLVYIDDSKLYETPFQAVLSMVITSFDPDYAYTLWHSKGGDANLASYENRFVDDLLESGRQTMDLEKRKSIYHRVHDIIHDDCPAIFLASGCEFIGSNYRFRGAGFASLMHFLTTTRDWQIVGEEREGVADKRQRKADVAL